MYVKGSVKALNKLNISIIGTRQADKDVKEFESNFTKNLIEKTGTVIVSGLAIGCNSIAYRTAVELDFPTIAILPAGVCNNSIS